MDAIKKLGGNLALPEIRKSSKIDHSGGFLDTLKQFAGETDEQIKKADNQMQKLAVGKSNDLQEVVMATEKADLSFKLLVQVRNKLLEAYQEIMRMQV
ncbi:MAG: flagellar hook-basal body complex protein FliE [Desulfatiglandaceae bacterium]